MPEDRQTPYRSLARRLLASCILLPAAACGPQEGGSEIVVSGYVEAIEVRVSTKVGGVVEELLIAEGDPVEAGQPMARLDTTDSRLALAAASADREQEEADLRLLLAGSRQEEIAEAQAEVQRAESSLAGARQELTRVQALVASGLEAEQKLDDATVRHDMARSSLEAARERLRKLQSGSRREEIEAARAAVAAAEARMAQLEQQLADASIVSPVAGVVTEKLTEAGELASRGSGIAIVTHLSEPWLNVFVAQPDLARIRIGQQAEVTTDDGQSRTGRVTFIATEAEFTPKNVQTRDERVKLVYKVKIGLENRDGMFKPGMPAEARLAPAAAAAAE